MITELKTLVLGQTKVIEVELFDEEGSPLSLFGSTFYFTLKDSPRNPDNQAVVSVSAVSPDNSDSAHGKGFLTIGSNAWGSAKEKQYYWSFQRVVTESNPEEVYPIARGKVNVVKAINSNF